MSTVVVSLRSFIQSADHTTGLVSITLFNIVNMGVHCRPQPRDIYFTTVYIARLALQVAIWAIGSLEGIQWQRSSLGVLMSLKYLFQGRYMAFVAAAFLTLLQW